ncbi:EF-hand domain-containing protein [Pleomorphomonas koreensis]|uniref:EF-hand domain-containing protein n=1 Tax=Pleomorphomonas koreensis TaxID=257440 RepID=UPI0003F59F65|nr:EF-hand domain-containing protein [Pleomorphomonas koreensis]
MKALTLATLSALSMIAVGGAALAAGPGMGPMGFGPAGGPAKMFNDADTNKDGKLDAAEIAAARDKLYAEANPSGKDGIDIQDFETWFWKQHREMMVRAFQRLDADGDGKITKAEMEAAGERMLNRLDRNDDGSYSMPSRPERGGWGRDGKHGRHHGPGMMQRWMGGNAAPADEPPAPPAADEAPAP